jgi:hypothetical protein
LAEGQAPQLGEYKRVMFGMAHLNTAEKPRAR